MLSRFFNLASGSVSHTERLVSALGGFIAIFAIYVISDYHLGADGTLLLVPSMGASAVLLFAVPHGALSQPWNVLGGHLISAVIGVSCYLAVPHIITAASLAVGLSIVAMYYLRCIHPPGGATALAAVIGGETTHALGYNYVLLPVLENTVVILAVAVIFNYAFKWRRYPVWPEVTKEKKPSLEAVTSKHVIEHSDLVAALSQIDSFIDVTEHDLLYIYDLATGQAIRRRLPGEQILQGHYYSNGAYGENWSVRQVVDESTSTDPDKDRVIYKVVAGCNLRSSGVLTRNEFIHWARHELVRDDENWRRVETATASDIEKNN